MLGAPWPTAPIDAGRFHVHGSHRAPAAGRARHAIEIDAGQAFGTGGHATTLGCLLALDRLARRRSYRQILDLGCGAGILAFAMARCQPGRVTAADNDPVAVQVTRDNARRNSLATRVTAQICVSCKCCSGILIFRRPRFILTLRANGSRSYTLA